MGHSYRDLHVWQKAMDFVTDIYALTSSFPNPELYGLTSQLRRAAVSIPSNIAEGQGRSFDREFGKFLSNAMGSVNEVETQLLIAVNLKFAEKNAVDQLLQRASEIGRLLNGLIRTVKTSE